MENEKLIIPTDSEHYSGRLEQTTRSIQEIGKGTKEKPSLSYSFTILKNNRVEITLMADPSNATIYYSLNPKDNKSGQIYTNPIIIDKDCEFSASAVIDKTRMSERISLSIRIENPTVLKTNSEIQEKDENLNISNNPIPPSSDKTGVQTTESTKDEEMVVAEKNDAESGAKNEKDSSLVKKLEDTKSTQADSTRIENKDVNIETPEIVGPTPESRIRLFTDTPNVIGISYRGEGHIRSNTPCQDCHTYQKINEAWNIAITSDGAGSAQRSEIGSSAICAAFSKYMMDFLNSKEYADGSIPDAKTWDIEFRAMLTKFQKEIKIVAANQGIEFKALAATIILLAYSPKGYIVAHVGDGRAGVKTNGEWKAIISPHKGEEANQTIFSTTIDFGQRPNLKMSGVYVPETNVSTDVIEEFVLMSDGLEYGLWHLSEKVDLPDGNFIWEPRNAPFKKGVEAAIQIIDLPLEERKNALMQFVIDYNKPIARESDDKTIIIGKVK